MRLRRAELLGTTALRLQRPDPRGKQRDDAAHDLVSTDRRLDVHEGDRSLVLMDDADLGLAGNQETKHTVSHVA